MGYTQKEYECTQKGAGSVQKRKNGSDGKCRCDLIPWEFIPEIAKVFEAGSQKHGDHNWRKGYRHQQYYASLMRHAVAVCSGKDIDEDGLLHLAAIAANAMILMGLREYYPELDDRPVKRPLPEGDKDGFLAALDARRN